MKETDEARESDFEDISEPDTFDSMRKQWKIKDARTTGGGIVCPNLRYVGNGRRCCEDEDRALAQR